MLQACSGCATPEGARVAAAPAPQEPAAEARKPNVEMETATTDELAEELAAGAPRPAPASEGARAAGGPDPNPGAAAARAGSEMLLDTHMCGADDSFAAPYGGFLVCA